MRDEDDRVRDRRRDTPRASCAPRDRGGSSARRAAADSAVRAAAWRARCASASRRRTFRTDGRTCPGRSRGRAARWRSAGPCCSRRRAGSGPAARCSGRAARRDSASARRAVGQAMLDVVHLGLHVEQRLKGAARLFEHRAARCATGRPAAGSRSSACDGVMMLPASGSSSRASIFSSVVLPAPFGPHRPTRSPSPICHVTCIEQRAIAEGLGEFRELDHDEMPCIRRPRRPSPWRRPPAPADAERLREVAGDAEIHRFDGARLGREPGDDDDRQSRADLLDLADQRQAVHAGHLQVGNQQVVRPRCRRAAARARPTRRAPYRPRTRARASVFDSISRMLDSSSTTSTRCRSGGFDWRRPVSDGAAGGAARWPSSQASMSRLRKRHCRPTRTAGIFPALIRR